MTYELLGAMSGYMTEQLEEMAQRTHNLKPGVYFTASTSDNTLSEPYVYNGKDEIPDQDYLEKDFWTSMNIQKPLDAKKKLHSAVYLCAAFRADNPPLENSFTSAYDKICDTYDQEKIKEGKGKATLVNIAGPLDKDRAKECLNTLESLWKEAAEKAKAIAGKSTLVKIFIDADISEYKREGIRYISLWLLYKQNSLVLKEGKVIFPATLTVNYNEKKKYMFPAGMDAPIFMSYEESYRLYLILKILVTKVSGRKERERIDSQNTASVLYLPFNGDLSNLDNKAEPCYRILCVNGKTGPKIFDFKLYEPGGEYLKNTMENLLGSPTMFEERSMIGSIFGYFFNKNADEKEKFKDIIVDFVTTGKENNYLSLNMAHKLPKLVLNAKYYKTAYNIVNTYLNVIGVKRMDIQNITCDAEYYFAAGQLAAWLCSQTQSETARKKYMGDFINAQKDNKIKLLIRRLMAIHSTKLRYDKSFKELVEKVSTYIPSGSADNMLIAGLFAENQLYRSKANSEASTEE